ncbi:MAG: chemotaxis protein CheW [Epsilonproteobacteria bacterium]|nr:MAG: chemotaxis protein CheW [Campylobacterota bacterium]
MNTNKQKLHELTRNREEYVKNVEEHQYLTFLLSGEVFAIEVLKVKEIIGVRLITPVPSMPSYILGVINVRGNVIPVVSLTNRFSLEPQEATHKTCIIIISSIIEGDATDIGIVVDMVNQVYDILPNNIESTPMFGSSLRKDFIQKIGKVNGKFISILDMDGISNMDEISKTNDKQSI